MRRSGYQILYTPCIQPIRSNTTYFGRTITKAFIFLYDTHRTYQVRYNLDIFLAVCPLGICGGSGGFLVSPRASHLRLYISMNRDAQKLSALHRLHTGAS